MKFLVLLFASVLSAQVIPSATPLPSDATKVYVVTPAQRLAMSNWKASAEIAHRKHDHEAFARAHREWWDACQLARVDNKLPVTAVCDYEKNIIRGKDAR